VGGKEQSGFHDQERLIRARWKSVVQEAIPCPDDNHFTVLDRFCNPSSALFKRTLQMMAIDE
jgi:hypothetical protein